MSLVTQALIAPALKGSLELQDVLLNDIRPDEALVEIHAVGVCHAELACLDGKIPVKFPNVFGHEGGGIIREVGDEVSEFLPGDKVILSYNYCRSCTTCRDGHPAYCEHTVALNLNPGGWRLDGSTTMKTMDGEPLYGNFFGQSSFARLAVVNMSCLVKVPGNTPLDILSPLGCGFQTGAGAVMNTLNVKKGESILIIGAGAVGNAAIMAAKIRQAGIIIAVDVNSDRLEISKSLGATHVINNTSGDFRAHVKNICKAGVMHAIDATSIPQIIEDMIDSLGPMGKAVSVGSPAPGTRVKVEVFSHITMGRQYLGCSLGGALSREMIPYLIDQYNQGNFQIDRLVKTYNITNFEEAIADMRSGVTIKPVLIW